MPICRCRVYLWYLQTIWVSIWVPFVTNLKRLSGGGPFFIVLINVIFIKRLHCLYSGNKHGKVAFCHLACQRNSASQSPCHPPGSVCVYVIPLSIFGEVVTDVVPGNVIFLIYRAAGPGRDIDKAVFLTGPDVPFLGCLSQGVNAKRLLPLWFALSSSIHLCLVELSRLAILSMTVWWYWMKHRSRILCRRNGLPPLISSIMRDGVAFFFLCVRHDGYICSYSL